MSDSDKKPSQDYGNPLGISLVLRRIFQNLSNDDLIAASCVNKLWNYEARSLMRERGNLIAHLKSGNDDKCGHLVTFASDLLKMNVIPFSGVSIDVRTERRPHEDCQSSSSTFLHQSVILDRLPWKEFSFQSGPWVNRRCKSFILATNIFKEIGHRLEQLTISVFDELDKVIQKIVQESYFSRLKILQLKEEAFASDEDYIDLVKTMISHAPNLQELHSRAPLRLLAKVLEGSSASLMYSPWTSLDQIPEEVIGALRLEKLKLRHVTGEDFSLERFNSIVPRLLQTSCTNLKSMQLDAVLALPLMCYRICLRNVTELFMNINFRELELTDPRVLSLLKDFDFTRILPSLSEISIGCLEDGHELSADDMNSIIEQADIIHMGEPPPDRAANIKHLNVTLEESTVPFFAQMFPALEKLSVSAHQEDFMEQPEIPFACIWTHWPDLKELEAFYRNMSHFTPRVANLDSVFCGIFPEEVAQLIETDEEYLKNVQIVPVMPSISCLKNLRTLKVGYNGLILEESHSDDPTFIFSKVTAFIAIRRCPGLCVTLEMGAC